MLRYQTSVFTNLLLYKCLTAVFWRLVLPLWLENKMMYRVFLLMWAAAMQIYWNKGKCLQEERGSIPTVSLFWDTNMAAMMSFENALLTFMQYFLGFLCVNCLSYLLKLSDENYLNPTSYEVIFFSHHTSILYQKA